MKPINRRELIQRLRRLGLDGPFSGKRHQFMRRPGDGKRLPLPNPHQGDISVGLLIEILKQAGISKKEWEKLNKK